MSQMTDETRNDFLDAYSAADDNHNGEISPDRFISLLCALGVSGGVATAQALLEEIVGYSAKTVTKDDYLKAVGKASLENTQIRRYKEMFSMFDKKKKGRVSRKSIEKGLKAIGIDVKGEIKEKIGSMRLDKGKISFGEFLRVQLQMEPTS